MSEPLAPMDLASRIARVDVYRGQALVTRVAELPAGAGGELVVRVGGLPLRLLDDSVRVRVQDAAARAGDLSLEWSLATRDAPVRTDAAELLHAARRERVGLESERRRWLDRAALLEGLAPAELGAADLPEDEGFAPRHPMAAWLALAGFVRQGLERAWGEVGRLDQALRLLDDRLAALEHELDQQSGAEAASLTACRKAARLGLVLPAGARGVVLELSYLVPLARWAPEYELRVEADLTRAELVLKALVAQRTGEDWEEVALACSTADLHRSTELPELESWRIGKAQPPRPSGWRPLPEGLEELFEGYDRGRGSLPAPPALAAPSLPELERLGDKRKAKGGRQDAGPGLAKALGALATCAPPPPPRRAPAPEPAPKMDMDDGLEADECAACEDGFAGGPPPPCAAPAAVMASSRSMPPPAPMRSGGRESAKKLARRPQAIRAKLEERELARECAVPCDEPDAAPCDEPGLASSDASRDALGYEGLRMEGPEASGRGQLRAVGAAERLVEQLAGRSAAGGLVGLAGDLGRALLEPERQALGRLALPAHAVDVASSAGSFALRYAMDGAGRVAADGQFHALSLLRREGEVKRVYRCVPLLDESVYLVAEFPNPLELPLLAGPVRVYRGGDFLVTAPLETTPPGKPLVVNMGVEPALRVARNTSFQESSGGLFGGDAVLDHQVDIEVRSRLAVAVRVEIFERVPVSHEEGVKVEVVRAAPEPEVYEQHERGSPVRGGRRFRLELPPGGVATCALAYRVIIPSKRVIEGGNRRV